MVITTQETPGSLALVQQNAEIADVDNPKEINPELFADVENHETGHQHHNSGQMQDNSFLHNRTLLVKW